MAPVQKTAMTTKGFTEKQNCVMLEKGNHNTAYRNMIGGYNPDDLNDDEVPSYSQFSQQTATPVTT